jgi:hypothetical protein
MSRELISISSGRGLALLAAVLCCGCDGAISIEGTVVTAPGVEESRIYVDQAAPSSSPQGTTRLLDASIRQVLLARLLILP